MAFPTTSDPGVARSNGRPGSSSRATVLPVPNQRVVCVEHPCLVKNIDNAVRSLGGEQGLSKLLLPPGETQSVALSLRPGDPFAQKLHSRDAYVNDVLLRVRMPRRTGRKRKRGTNDPFTYSGNPFLAEGPQDRPQELSASWDGASMPQHLKHVQTRSIIEPVGIIHETHRFRSLPDFQLNSDSSMMREVRKSLVWPTMSSIKQLQLNTTSRECKDIHGAPQFASSTQPMHYIYEQNPAVATVTTEQGKIKMVNLQAPRKRDNLAIAHDSPSVPHQPPDTLPPLNSTNKYHQQAVKNLNKVIQQRPVVTRLVAMNLCDFGSETLFKEATQYVGYSFRSGPFKNTLIKFGVDPRSDPSYRVYQPLSFQLMVKDEKGKKPESLPWVRNERAMKDHAENGRPQSHMFDGKTLSLNGRTWQICDITDPTLKQIFDTTELREECDVEGLGWYYNGTMSAARIVMRDKINKLLEKQQQQQKPDTQVEASSSSSAQDVDDKIWSTIANKMPAAITEETIDHAYLMHIEGENTKNEKLQSLCTDIRTMSKMDATWRGKPGGKSGGSRTKMAVQGKGKGKEKEKDIGERRVRFADEEGSAERSDEEMEDEEGEDEDDFGAMADVEALERQADRGSLVANA